MQVNCRKLLVGFTVSFLDPTRAPQTLFRTVGRDGLGDTGPFQRANFEVGRCKPRSSQRIVRIVFSDVYIKCFFSTTVHSTLFLSMN